MNDGEILSKIMEMMQKVSDVTAAVQSVDRRMEKIETGFSLLSAQINARLAATDKRIAEIETLEKKTPGLEKIDERLDALENRDKDTVYAAWEKIANTALTVFATAAVTYVLGRLGVFK